MNSPSTKSPSSSGRLQNSLFTKAKDTNGLKTSTTFKPDTYCLRAQVVYNNAYHNSLGGKESRDVKRAVAKGINSNLKAVRN